MTTINMTEFKEEHKVSLLMGSPPGYVGYGEGGILTEAVRRRPYSVVLLDEMEKAHPGVQDVFFQVFDKGNMKDGEGRDIDFKNTVIIMTSNAGTDLITKLFADPETAPDALGLAEALRPELSKYFKPAFLGRVTIVPYFPLAGQPSSARSSRCNLAVFAVGCRRRIVPISTGTRSWSRRLPLAARRVHPARVMSRTSYPAACFRNCRPRSCLGSPRAKPSGGST